MPRRRRAPNGIPWYRPDRDCWVTPGCPKKTPLRDHLGHIIRGPDSRDAALSAWQSRATLQQATEPCDDNLVIVVLEKYLGDLCRRATAKTVKSYTGWFNSFAARWPGLTVAAMKASHVYEWWDGQDGWGDSVKCASGTALKAAFKWASDTGRGDLCRRNPISGLVLPAMRRRAADVVLTEAEFRSAFDLIPAASPLRDILLVAWESGTRPVNLIRAEAHHLSPARNALVLPVHKTVRKTGRPLTVPLSATAATVVCRLADARPLGPLFLTAGGKPWTDSNLATQVAYYAKKVGLGSRFTPYSCRHSRATEMLEQGMSDVDVAAVLGNTPAVIHRHYSHVQARASRLVDLLNRSRAASGTATPSGAEPPPVGGPSASGSEAGPGSAPGPRSP